MSRFFLVCCVLTFCPVSGQSPTYALLGQMFYLKPDIAEHPDDILWKHNGSKVVEFNGKEGTAYGVYDGRVTLGWVNAELTMTDLRYEDSGEYELETYKNKQLHTLRYKLEVIDNVTKATISCDMTDGKSDVHGTKATLMCSANPTRPQSLMKFEWVGNMQSGPNLTITLEGEDDDKKYTCRVSNPLTSATATFTAKNCYSGRSSPVALAVSLSIIILIALALVVGGILFCKKTRKACFGKKNGDDVEKPLPGGETGESDKETTPENELRPLLDREPTIPSSQQLRHLGQNNENLKRDVPVSDPKEDTDAHWVKGRVQELKKKFEPGEGEQTLPPDTHTESKESEEEHSPPANGMSPPTAQPRLSLTQNSPDKGTKDTADEHKEDAQSDQVNEGTSGKNVRESDSAGSEQRNESDDSSEEKESSTVPEQSSSETALHEQKSKLSGEEKHTREDDQQETEIKPRHDLDEPGSSTADADQVEHEVGTAEKTEGRDQEPKRKSEPSEGEQTLPPDAQTDSHKKEKEQSPPVNGMSPPTAQPRSSLTQNSPDKETKDTADEHKEDAQSDQVKEGTSEKNVRESDSAGSEQRNESDDYSEEKQSSTVPEQSSSETALHEQKSKLSGEEKHTREDDQQKVYTAGSEGKSDAGSEGESPTQTEPDNTKTKTFQESVKTPHADQETEIKTKHDLDEPGSSSTADADQVEHEVGTAEKIEGRVQELKKKFEQGEGEQTPDAQTGVGTDKKTEDHYDQKQEKPGNENL